MKPEDLRMKKRQPFTLLICAALALTVARTHAAEIRGTVRVFTGDTATATIEGELVPNVGDKAEIFFKLAGVEGEIFVATGSVVKVEGDSIQVKIEKATGEVAKDQIVRITSDKPQPRVATAASASPKPGAEPPEATPSSSPALAQTPAPSPTVSPAAVAGPQPNAAEMEQMMALGKTNENHKLLAGLAGNWTYTVKMWTDPKAPPSESKGTSTRKAIMDGRFFISEHTGKFQIPGPDGKMQVMSYKNMAIEGYDNVRKKFVSSFIDNMGTMIMSSEGTYDPATRTFTYHAEYEVIPGTMTKVREVITIVDNDHHTFEWYDNSSGREAKTMEISYTRKK